MPGLEDRGRKALSALFLVVPEAEVLLDAVRGLPGVALLEPAHISLGYPWVADAQERLDEVRAAAAAVPSGDVLLLGPERFEQDVRRRTVVHAGLSDGTIPRELARLLGAPLRTPHLSIARVNRGGDVDEVVAAVAHLLPISVRLDTLELTQRDSSGWTTLLKASLA